MTKAWLRRTVLLAVGATFALAPSVRAEDVEKRFRVGLSLGYANPEDRIESDAANVLTLVDHNFETSNLFLDPRDDSSVFGNLELKPSPLIVVNGQYALSKIFLIEASVGYTKTQLGKVELQAQFDGVAIDQDINFNFATFRIDAGDVERVPIKLSGIARFRPRARLNPYFGLGIGYSFVGFSPTSEFNAWSVNLDRSAGGQGSVSSALDGSPAVSGPAPGSSDVGSLSGASVQVSDSFEWHVRGGAEYALKPKWALVFDLAYSQSSRTLSIGFNGQEDLGIAVPQLNDFEDSPVAQQTFGPVRITTGGVVDGGSVQPLPGAPAGTNCVTSPALCQFDPNKPDGVVDSGFYYINGGELNLKSFDYTVGVRYTF